MTQTLREIKCDNKDCNSLILRKSNDGLWRFSTKVIKLNDTGTNVIAVCKSCGKDNILPINMIMVGSKNNQKESPKKSFRIVQVDKKDK